jgi:hypothetical protein
MIKDDPYSLITIESIKLIEIKKILLVIDNPVTVDTINADESYVFTNIKSNKRYIIEVNYEYNLEDGSGNTEKTYELEINT